MRLFLGNLGSRHAWVTAVYPAASWGDRISDGLGLWSVMVRVRVSFDRVRLRVVRVRGKIIPEFTLHFLYHYGDHM